MAHTYDVAAIGNAIVDVIAPSTDAFLDEQDLTKGSMHLIDGDRAQQLYGAMAPGMEASGGSAGNTVAGVASFGGTAAYIGKVAKDQLGEVFTHDLRAQGVHFETPPLEGADATARSLINVTPDGQRTMSTFLGVAGLLNSADVDDQVIKEAPSPISRAICSTRPRRARPSTGRPTSRARPGARWPSPCRTCSWSSAGAAT